MSQYLRCGGTAVLGVLGLDAMAESVYRLLLRHRGWGVEQVAAHLEWPEDSVQETLDRLTELRLLRRSGRMSNTLQVVGPEIGLQLLLGRRESELRKKQQELAEGQAAVQTLVNEYTAGAGGLHEVEHLPTAEATWERAAELLELSAKECVALLPRCSLAIEAGNRTRDAVTKALDRGISVAALCHTSVRNDRDALAFAEGLVSEGAEVRTVATLPVEMLLFDRTTAILSASPDSSAGGAVRLSGSGVIAALGGLFDQTWRMATRIDQAERTHGDTDLTETEIEMVRLMSHGCTDEVAARKLGLSLRTVRRMVARLMERLQARSRFEAGVRAAKLGWLD